MSKTEEENKQDVVDLIKEYIATKIELGRLTILERLIVIVASLLTDGFILVTGLLTFLFGSVALGCYFGELFNSYAKGFGLMTLIYLVLALTMFFIKDKFVDKYLHNFMVKRIFQNKK